MKKEKFYKIIDEADRDGTLLTPKHDPAKLSPTYKFFRSVLTGDLPPKLINFLKSDQCDIVEYENMRYPNSPCYIEIIPRPGSVFSIPASGVQANSPNPTGPLDRLVVVSGAQLKWHIYGEDSIEIQRRVSCGYLRLVDNDC